MSDDASVLDRREFLRVSGTAAGAMIIAVSLPRALTAAREPNSAPWEPSVFIRIDADGTVTLTVPRPDMGQGVRTSLPMIIAEELDADWTTVKLVQADYDLKYGDQWAGGSSSVRGSWDPMRQAGATTRAMLVAAAAARWSVLSSECGTQRGAVIHLASGRRLTYGQLAAAAALLPVLADVPVKPASAYRLIGTRQPSVDAPAIVRGAQKFGLDQRVPGMLFAVIERAPMIGGQVASVDPAKALAMPGVRHVVPIDASVLKSFGEDNPRPRNGVAVIATSTWAAMKGRAALAIAWKPGPGSDASSAQIREQSLALAAKPAEEIIVSDGNAAAAMSGAAHIVEAAYEVPLLAHAPMEPMNCLADVRTDHCTVWAPIQNPRGAHDALEIALGLPGDAVDVHVTRSGGGFGRRFYADFAVEAALLSRAAGAPVQVVWSREDDIKFDFYRPSGYHVMRAGLAGDGSLVAWTQFLINAPRGEFLEWAYPAGSATYPAGRGEVDRGDFPSALLANFRLEASRIPARIPLGQWRAIDSSSNIFVIESFFDEVARAAGRDPVEMKIAILANPAASVPRAASYDRARLATVLKLAALKGDWGVAMPAGQGRGIASAYANGAYVAEVAEVEVAADGKVVVKRIVAAVDIGRVVNVSGAEAQVQGAIIYGLSAALMEQITFENGRAQQNNFNDFPALRMRDTPVIEVYFVPSDAAPHGIGEGALPCAAPAVANALFAATGKRVRALPINS